MLCVRLSQRLSYVQSRQWRDDDAARASSIRRTLLCKALEVAGPERLLFGSDSLLPRGWHAQIYETQIQALYDLEVGGEQARMILGGNLERLLGKAS